MIPAIEAVRTESARVASLAGSLEPTDWNRPSMCDGWTIADVIGHLANDFERFSEWLADSLRGRLTEPFPPEQFRSDNAVRLEQFTGVPGPARVRSFERAFAAWFERVASLDPQTPQRHPRGAITVERQAWFAAGECSLHGWDIATAIEREWEAPAAAAEIAASWALFRPVGPGDPWLEMLRLSGRPAGGATEPPRLP